MDAYDGGASAEPYQDRRNHIQVRRVCGRQAYGPAPLSTPGLARAELGWPQCPRHVASGSNHGGRVGFTYDAVAAPSPLAIPSASSECACAVGCNESKNRNWFCAGPDAFRVPLRGSVRLPVHTGAVTSVKP